MLKVCVLFKIYTIIETRVKLTEIETKWQIQNKLPETQKNSRQIGRNQGKMGDDRDTGRIDINRDCPGKSGNSALNKNSVN